MIIDRLKQYPANCTSPSNIVNVFMARSRWKDHLLPRGVLFATDERNELYIKEIKL